MNFKITEESKQIALRAAIRPGERVIASAYGHIDGFKYSFIGHMFIFMLVFTLTLMPIAYAFEYIDSKVTLCIVCAISTAVCTTIMFFIDIAFTGSVIGTRNSARSRA